MKLNLEKRYSFPKLNSFGTDTETNIIKLFKGNKNNELEDIFDLINKESKIYNEPPFNSVNKITSKYFKCKYDVKHSKDFV